ncbi:MAG: hypothetical protein GY801_06995 [bacterium]|nr:hypothetical protein [bacterium]
MESPGSQLCLACGLCCRGILHAWVVLKPDEIKLAGRQGLLVNRKDDKDVFFQPCVCYVEHRCRAYDRERPSVCIGYRCKLLQRLLHEKVSLQDALHIAEQVNAIVVSIYRHGEDLIDRALALQPQLTSIFERQEDVEFRRAHAALLMAIVKFRLLNRRHFGGRKSKKAQAMSDTTRLVEEDT